MLSLQLIRIVKELAATRLRLRSSTLRRLRLLGAQIAGGLGQMNFRSSGITVTFANSGMPLTPFLLGSLRRGIHIHVVHFGDLVEGEFTRKTGVGKREN